MPAIEIGLNEDSLPLLETLAIAREAQRLGFSGLWTPENRERSGFVACAFWGSHIPDLRVGIGVLPARARSPHSIALDALTVQEVTGGRFTLGLGAAGGGPAWGTPADRPIAAMTDYVRTVRALVAGKRVFYQGKTIQLAGDEIVMPGVPPVPVFLGALGPQMLAVAGRWADGVLLNWANEARVQFARETVARAASAVGRDPSSVTIAGYIRVSVDDDEERARQAVARQTLKFWRMPHYRAQWEAMGFGEARRKAEEILASDDPFTAAASLPDSFLRSVSAYGTPAAAARRFAELAAGLDIAIARIVPARPGRDGVLAVLDALAPARQ
ncbi:MAG: LLM class flavin-dependent oxidoreductase [Chloroflexota bacterium]|nr:LLM class flavin-dependent oxidoreductase [Dehalococcoidia bacterium]MDW8253266.1 LLM class flavin-dependent oxidoreductase [Chloroflexota bacterium]